MRAQRTNASRSALIVMLLVVSGCSAGELSVKELLGALQKEGLTIVEVTRKSQLQREFDELAEAMSQNVPMPQLAKTLEINDVPTDLVRCPGRAQQANLITAIRLRGRKPGEPPLAGAAADLLTGNLNVPFQQYVFSMSPDKQQDAQVLEIALALSRLETQ